MVSRNPISYSKTIIKLLEININDAVNAQAPRPPSDAPRNPQREFEAQGRDVRGNCTAVLFGRESAENPFNYK
jgi:hypothetical protein